MKKYVVAVAERDGASVDIHFIYARSELRAVAAYISLPATIANFGWNDHDISEFVADILDGDMDNAKNRFIDMDMQLGVRELPDTSLPASENYCFEETI